MEENVIELRNITKSFPGIVANDDISLTLRRGEIHALLGENGAGKSTLMSILFGLNYPDSGTILVDGEEVFIRNPNDATKYGIGMVHQHFKLVGCYTAIENIILGNEPTTGLFGFLKPKSVRAKLQELCQKYKFEVDLDKKIDDMAVGEQQKVEILKMLFRDNHVLIFDEPTAVLTPQEIDDLMQSMKELVKEGKSILFISHKLNEIMEISDRISVLRKGKLIATVNKNETDVDKLSYMMVGRNVDLNIQKKEIEQGKTILTVKNVTVYDEDKKKDVVHNVSFDVHANEIVALAGIEGNGQSELVYALTGIKRIRNGECILHDVDRYRYIDLNKKGKENIFNKSIRYIKGNIKFAYVFLKEHLKAFTVNYIYNPVAPVIRKCANYISSLFKVIFFKNKDANGKKLTYKEMISLYKDNHSYTKYSVKRYTLPQEEDKMDRLIDVHLEDLSVRKRCISGISHIPEDRQKYGLALDFSLKDNLVLQRYFEKGFQNCGFINEKKKIDYGKELIKNYDIRSSLGLDSTVRSMSGGNQQKAIIARELDRDSSLIIACQPTRGLDIGAIEMIHKDLVEKRNEGKAILLVSLELDEVMNLADRILVMYNGEIVASLDPKNTDRKEIGLYMSGAKRMEVKDE